MADLRIVLLSTYKARRAVPNISTANERHSMCICLPYWRLQEACCLNQQAYNCVPHDASSVFNVCNNADRRVKKRCRRVGAPVLSAMTTASPVAEKQQLHTRSPSDHFSQQEHALCRTATTTATTSNPSNSYSQFSQGSNFAMQNRLAGLTGLGGFTSGTASTLGACFDVDNLLKSVTNASKHLQEQREQLQQQALQHKLLQQQLQAPSAQCLKPLLETLAKARADAAAAAGPAADSAQGDAAAVKVAAGSCSPLSPAPGSSTAAPLQHTTSNLSSYSSLPSLQQVFSALQPGPSGAVTVSQQLSGLQPGKLQRGASSLGSTGCEGLTQAESATAAELISQLEAIKAAAAAAKAAASPRGPALQQQASDESNAAGISALGGSRAPVHRQLSKAWKDAADIDEDDGSQAAERFSLNASGLLGSCSNPQLAAKAQQMCSLLGQINQLQQQSAGLAAAAAARGAAAAAAARPAPEPATSGEAPSGLSEGGLDSIVKAATGHAASAAAATTAVAAAPAACGPSTVAPQASASGYDPAQLQRVLEDVVNTKKQVG